MASEIEVIQMAQIQPIEKELIEQSPSEKPLALRSVSKLFKSGVNREISGSKQNFKGLEEAMHNHDMDRVKHHLLCNCPLQSDVSVGSLKAYRRGSSEEPEKSESVRGLDLLCLAATYGRTDIVHLLLNRLKQESIEPEELFDLTYSLHQACKLNNKNIVEKLLKAGATPWEKDEEGFSAMHHSAFNGSLEVMKTLVDHDGSIYARTDDGRTLLHLAARKGYTTLVEYLLCNDACTDVLDKHDCTPLHYACISGVDNVVLLLLRNKCPVDQINTSGRSGLYIAAEKGSASIIPILLSFGASIDMRCCCSYRTPLMAASISGHVTSVQELINNGASFHCTDAKRNSALELALRNGRDSAAALLILREAPYMDYVQEFIRTQEYALCKVVKNKLVKSAAALLDRMVIPEEGNTSQVKVMLQYLDTDISNNLPSDNGFLYSHPYFIKLIADNRLEDLAYHGTVRLYVQQQMHKFGRYFLIYKTILFFLFLVSMFYSFVVVATQSDPNDYQNWNFVSVLRLIVELYVLCFWVSNVITEVTEIIEIMYRTFLYLKHKREKKTAASAQEIAEDKYLDVFSSPRKKLSKKNSQRSPSSESLPESQEEGEHHAGEEEEEMKEEDLWSKVKHCWSNFFFTRFLTEYFSDNFNWFDQGGLISLFITFILRAASSPLQWLFMPITFFLNCMRIFKLFNVYYSFGTYIRILASVSFNEIPPFLMFFCWTLFVFSGAYFVSLRLPTDWTCPNGTTCKIDEINLDIYSEGYDDQIWFSPILGLRVLLEQGPVFLDNYLLRLNWLSVIIFLIFLFITSVVYLNLLIAQLTDRYSQVKKVALKVVAWYRLNFIIQSQDTSLIARFYNFRKKRRTDCITLSAKALNKYYGVDGVDEFVQRGSLGFREYLPDVDNVQLLAHQKYSSRMHELNEGSLLRQFKELKVLMDKSTENMDRLTTEMKAKYDCLDSKMDDITRLLTSLLDKSTLKQDVN